MDELKKYIQNHAEELDLDEPRPQVWHNIRRETEAVKKPSVVMMVTRWAAAACLLVLAGIGAWSVLNNKDASPVTVAVVAPAKQDTPVAATTEPTIKAEETAAVNEAEPVEKRTTTAQPQYKNTQRNPPPQNRNNDAALAALHNVETSFTQVINLQRARVSTMPMYAESPEYFNDFKIQIRQMEKDEKVIKSDIAKRGMNDEILDQLINLYQQKLNTLKQLQIEMNKTNNRYKQNRGPVDSSKIYFMNL